MPNLFTHVGKVRAVGALEGISFLLLLGVAVPLKRLAGIPEPVTWVGWIHGLLFISYCLVLLLALVNGALSFKKSGIAFLASLVPFGPFLFDRKLAEAEAREKSAE